jgi:hypothetical protein
LFEIGGCELLHNRELKRVKSVQHPLKISKGANERNSKQNKFFFSLGNVCQ